MSSSRDTQFGMKLTKRLTLLVVSFLNDLKFCVLLTSEAAFINIYKTSLRRSALERRPCKQSLTAPAPRVPSLLFQKSSVDFWFQKAGEAVVFHQTIYKSLCPVKAVGARLWQILADFFPRHAVNVYLFRKHFHFTHQFLFFFLSSQVIF